MKLTIKYEPDEIKALVREDLARQGIPAADAQVEFNTDHVVITVEATRDGTLASKVPTPPAVTNTNVVTNPPPAATTPPMTVVEGGAAAVDMSEVLAASQQVAQQKKPLYGERPLMEGESHEFPGAPKR